MLSSLRSRFGQLVAQKILTAFHEIVPDNLDILIRGVEDFIVLPVLVAKGAGELIGFFGRHDEVKGTTNSVQVPIVLDRTVNVG